VADIIYRQATLDDAGEIHDLLLRVAPEIPVLVDTLERQEKLYALTRICARSGESWVACGRDGRIVGFALVELSEHGRHYAEHEVLELHHAGVAPDCRRQGLFAALIGHIQERMLPIAADVNRQNRADAVRQFEKLGFRDSGAAGGDLAMRWHPG
jgi:ribosomal protein S18 acetylase RimI-like enzyme